jgi:hypothetical protein
MASSTVKPEDIFLLVGPGCGTEMVELCPASPLSPSRKESGRGKYPVGYVV